MCVHACVQVEEEQGLFINDKNCLKGTQQNWRPTPSLQLFLPYPKKRSQFCQFYLAVSGGQLLHNIDIYHGADNKCWSCTGKINLVSLIKVLVTLTESCFCQWTTDDDNWRWTEDKRWVHFERELLLCESAPLFLWVTFSFSSLSHLFIQTADGLFIQ